MFASQTEVVPNTDAIPEAESLTLKAFYTKGGPDGLDLAHSPLPPPLDLGVIRFWFLLQNIPTINLICFSLSFLPFQRILRYLCTSVGTMSDVSRPYTRKKVRSRREYKHIVRINNNGRGVGEIRMEMAKKVKDAESKWIDGSEMSGFDLLTQLIGARNTFGRKYKNDGDKQTDKWLCYVFSVLETDLEDKAKKK